jgi:hypothetical protein
MHSEDDLDLAKKLAHGISLQASGTKNSERTKMARMAHLIEALLGEAPTADDREQALAELHPSQ